MVSIVDKKNLPRELDRRCKLSLDDIENISKAAKDTRNYKKSVIDKLVEKGRKEKCL